MIRARRELSIALLAITGLTLAACGGDDSSTKATEPAAVETTAAAPDTVAPETTEAVEETVAPETTEAVEFLTLTSSDLAAAVPAFADLGEGWTDTGQETLLDPEGKEGPGIGTCGGPNAAARAIANGATGIAYGPFAVGTDQRRVSVSLYAFPDDAAAQAFIDLSAQTADCAEPVTWERIQKANPVADNEFNGFGEGFEEVTENQIWSFSETGSSQYGETEDVMETGVDRTRELTAANITFRQTDTTLAHYERYDNVVIQTILVGTWGMEGYINLEQFVQYQPTQDDLEAYGEIVIPIVLERLGWE